jgi:hypothetical protein
LGTWLKANGGPLALAVLGVALTGYTTPYGWILVALGVVWWLGAGVRQKRAKTLPSSTAPLPQAPIQTRPRRPSYPALEINASQRSFPNSDPLGFRLTNFRVTSLEERTVSLTIEVFQKLRGTLPLHMSGGQTVEWARVLLDESSGLPQPLTLKGEDPTRVYNPRFYWPYDSHDLADVDGRLGEYLRIDVTDHLAGKTESFLPTAGLWRSSTVPKDGG